MSRFPQGFHPLEQDLVRRVLEAAAGTGAHLYLVGGYLRDAIMGRYGPDHPAMDFDYAVEGKQAVPLARQLAGSLGGHFVLLDQELDTARVVFDSGQMLDFAGCTGGTIENDVRRRDFTVNALVWDPEAPDDVLDLTGGLADLERRRIRAIAEQNFLDDPLRMLRAYRFSTVLDGAIEDETRRMISRHSSLLGRSAPERISYELFLIANAGPAAATLKDMGETGLLEVIFPELRATRKVPRNAFHHLALWEHSLETVAQAALRLPELPQAVREDLQAELSAGVTRLGATRIACLLHDIGKPDTWQVSPDGRHSFYGHDRLGAEMCEAVADRLKWSRQVSRFVVKLVRWHLRPGQLFHQGPPTRRAVHRFYRSIGQDVPPLMVLAFGDLGATRGPGLEGDSRLSLEKNLLELLEGYYVFMSSQKAAQRFLNGNDVMRLLNIQPGPLVAEILGALEEAQGLDEVRSREQAERFVIAQFGSKLNA